MGTGAVVAQEALRDSLASETVAEARQRELENAPHNVQWGDLQMQVTPSLALEWDDNLNLTSTQPVAGVALRPTVSLDAVRPWGHANAFKFALTAGYEHYFAREAFDRRIIEPGSELSADVYVRDFVINIHERPSFIEESDRDAAVWGYGRFGGFSNTAGFSVLWDLRDLVVSVGYDHFNFLSSSGQFNYLDRAAEQAVARAGYQVHPTATVGLEVSGGPTSYDRPYLNDNLSVSVGAYADWRLTPHLRLQPRVGYVTYTFQGVGVAGTPADFTSYYWGLRLTHQVNAKISYDLDSGRNTRLGIYANLLDQWETNLRVTWRVLNNVSLLTQFSYVRGNDPFWMFGDEFQRFGGNLELAYRLLDRLTVSLDYWHWDRSSNLAVAQYQENRVSLRFDYRL